MKILFLMPHLKISGGNRIALNYAHFLAERGYDVEVLVSSRSFWRRRLANFLKVKIGWYKNLKAKIVRVKDFEAENLPDADIVVACAWYRAEAMMNYPKEKGVKFHLIMHDERLYHGSQDKVDEVYKFNSHKIVISNWIAERLEKDFGQKSEVLLTPVDFDLFHPVDVPRNKNEIKVLMLHHTYEWKGVDEGLKAFQAVKAKYSNLKLVLYGARAEKPEIPHDKYYYNPPQKKLREIFSSVDIFLCPSEWEGLGMPAMEAMACKTCVVTYDTGGSRDYAFDGKNALVAEHKNVDDLTRKLEMAVGDKELRDRLAQAGYDFIHNEIDTWQKSTDKLEKIFKDSLEK